MRSKSKRSVDHIESEGRATTTRRKRSKQSGVPKLSLWECGVGSAWK